LHNNTHTYTSGLDSSSSVHTFTKRFQCSLTNCIYEY